MLELDNQFLLTDECMNRLLEKDTDAPIHAIRYGPRKKATDTRFDGVKAWLNDTSAPSSSHNPPDAVSTAGRNRSYAPKELKSE